MFFLSDTIELDAVELLDVPKSFWISFDYFYYDKETPMPPSKNLLLNLLCGFLFNILFGLFYFSSLNLLDLNFFG